MSFSRSDYRFYDGVPKDVVANVKYRERLMRELQSPSGRSEIPKIKAACAADPLFFVNTFAWTYDPRLGDQGKNPVVPFVTFDVQDELIHNVFECLGKCDMLIEKSRDVGASWCCLMPMCHQFLFESNQQFGLASDTAEHVDKTGSKDSLFWKIEFMFRLLPWFLRPKYLHNERMLLNEVNDSSILGSAASGNAFRSGRHRAVLLDEFASFIRSDGYDILAATADVTNSRIFNSTPKGTGNAFFDVREKISKGFSADGKILQIHWSEDTRKNAGLYTNGKGYRQFYPGAMDHHLYTDDSVVFLKHTPNGREVQEMQFDSDYQFLTDGKLRSPWYDRECRRRAHPMLVAQELDIDYHNSSFRFFDEGVIQNVLSTQKREPLALGTFTFHDDDSVIAFDRESKPHWQLWYHGVDNETMRPLEYMRCAIAADISAGTGASNSCLSVVDVDTGEKIAEYANPSISPENFGRYAVQVARLFNEAFLIWENNGPGRNFGQKVLDAGYGKIYRLRDDVSIKHKTSDIPGWPSSPEKKFALLSNYRDALAHGLFTNPSEAAILECREYINLPGDKVVHSAANNSLDPTGAGKSHGDRVIADALAWKAVTGLKPQRLPKGDAQMKARPVPQHSMKSRIMRREEAEKRTEFRVWS